MKIAITTSEPTWEAQLNPRFGRCSYFVILDSETRDWQAVPNPAVNAMGGAGPQAAQFLANHAVEAVITGGIGPNAHSALQAAGIQMYQADSGSVEGLVEAFLQGELEAVSGPTGPQRHGGRGRRRG